MLGSITTQRVRNLHGHTVFTVNSTEYETYMKWLNVSNLVQKMKITTSYSENCEFVQSSKTVMLTLEQLQAKKGDTRSAANQ